MDMFGCVESEYWTGKHNTTRPFLSVTALPLCFSVMLSTASRLWRTLLRIGVFVPLNNNLEEDNSIPFPKVPTLSAATALHLLTRDSAASISPCSCHVFVEGTNPIVIRSQDQRKKLLSGEKSTIYNGDVMDLIPGHL